MGCDKMGVDVNADGCGRGAKGGAEPKVGWVGTNVGSDCIQDTTQQKTMSDCFEHRSHSTYSGDVQLGEVALELVNLVIACHSNLLRRIGWAIKVIEREPIV